MIAAVTGTTTERVLTPLDLVAAAFLAAGLACLATGLLPLAEIEAGCPDVERIMRRVRARGASQARA